MKKIISTLLLLTLSTISFAAYEDHFPVYFEYCTGSQWKLQTGEEGGPAGHGFNYIHGLCKDYRYDYPQVIPCSEVSRKLKARYPHEGVGISLDKNFGNVMWVAVPGRDFLMFGDTQRKSINKKDIESHIRKVSKLKIFSGVISQSKNLENISQGTQEYLDAFALDTLGTDHAVNWARGLHCVKVPAPSSTLPAVAKFLNDSNNQYRSGPYYQWSMLRNNCVHLSLNQSHAMGISKGRKVDQKFIQMLRNMAVPANAFLMYADVTVLAGAPDLGELKEVLPKKGFHPVQVGSIMEAHDVFPSGEYFDTEDLESMTAPRILKPWRLFAKPKSYERKYMTAERTDLKANAELWIKRYENLINDLDSRQRGSSVESYLFRQLELSRKIFLTE